MWRKVFSLIITLSLVLQQVGFASMAAELNLAGHLSKMSAMSVDRFRPVHIRFFSFDMLQDNIKVMLDKGDLKAITKEKLSQSTQELLNYFLVGLTLPNDTFWVNLRPDSENEIIDDWLAQTDVGKIMLEADLQLKKDTARFTSPETIEGKEYWSKLYLKAEELYGNAEVTIPTLTRPWIVPNEIIVRETKDSSYIYKATLKVMLEQDVLKGSEMYSFKDERSKALNEYSSQLIREIILPKLTTEVNLSKRYSALRQVYYSLIFSRWFKSRFSDQTGKYASLIDQKDLTGLTSISAWSKTSYFDAYKKSFAQGEYNVKETVRTPTGQVIRSYFSGGADLKFNANVFNGGTAGSPIINALNNVGLISPEGTSSPITTKDNFELFNGIPQAVKDLAGRDLTGVNVLIRVNLNVKSKNGVLDDTIRLDKTADVVNFVRSLGGTVILLAHNGRLDKKKNKDERQSFTDAAKYLQDKVFPGVRVVLHENSIVKDEGTGLKIKRSDIITDAINIIENVRFADDYEVGVKRMIFAKSLINLAGDQYGGQKILIFDAFGDAGSGGASVETLPYLADEVYTGPAMVEEFATIETIMKEGFDALIMGSGPKVDEKVSLLGRLVAALRNHGFSLLGSGPSPKLNSEMKDFLAKLRNGDSEKVITALDYSDKTKFDIGSQTLNKFLAKLDTLKAGQRVLVNGTMGYMEEASGKYQAGTKAIFDKLIELARRGVQIVIVGGDAGNTAKKYGLDKEKNVISFTGGGVSLSIIANEALVGLKALVRRQNQIEIKKATPADAEVKFNVVINGARGRMGLLYLHNLLYDPEYADMRVVALSGIPMEDLDDLVKKLHSPDSTYGPLFPGADIKVIERNIEKRYAVIEINGNRMVVLNDRKDAIRWNLVGDLFGESFLTRLGVIETSGQNYESDKSLKTHLANAGDALVEFGAPPKDEGTPIIVLSVNEENLDINAQVFSNASCTTNAIAPVANKIHKAFTVKKGVIMTIHAETSDQSSYETFRGDEPARARPGHKIQSPAKTGAAKLLGKLIKGIGPNDGKAIRVGTLTGSVVIYTAELEKPATVEEVREMFIQANKDDPRVFGIGHNLASRDIVKDPHSTIVDLDSIQVSADGKTLKIATWYDNEWGYAKRGLDTLKRALNKQAEGTRTKDFPAPQKAAKATKETKVTPASEMEGLTSEGALPVFIPALKSATGRATDLYLTGIKEKQASRYGQIFIRMLLGDPRFNLKGIVVDGITEESFDASMKAFAQSIIYSSDLGNLEGIKITPKLTDKKEMYLVFQVGNVTRLVRVLPAENANLEAGAQAVDVTKIKYSYLELLDTVSDTLKPLNAKQLSAAISMSTRPGGELLDSGKGISVPANMIPVKIKELDEKGLFYQAYQVPVNSGSYIFVTYSIEGLVDKDAVHKLLKTIPDIVMEDTTSSHFVSNRSNIVLDKSQTLIVQDKKDNSTLVSLFFLVNEELNSASRVLEGMVASSAIELKVAEVIPSQTTTLGSPTLRVDIQLKGGAKGHFVIPAGTSTGEDEAHTIMQDTGFEQVAKNVRIVNERVAAMGLKADQVVEIGQLMLSMDKDILGAETTLAYQMASAWAAARQMGLEPYEFIRLLAADLASKGVPITKIQYNITNGGQHAANNLDMQEFMVVPIGKTTAEANAMADNIDRHLGVIYQALGLQADPNDKGVGKLRGKEGGYKIEDLTIEKLSDIYQNAEKYNIENLDILALRDQKIGVHEFVLNCQLAAIKNAGYEPAVSNEAGTVSLALDPAATSMLIEGHDNLYNFEGRQITSKELVGIYASWAKNYPIDSIEDGLGENDWNGFMDLIEAVGDKVMVVTDDITVSQAGRFLKFIDLLKERGFIGRDGKVTKRIAILIKLNQNGFLTTGINDLAQGYLGTLEVIRLAKKHGIEWVVSHRSKEAEPSENEVSIAEVAAGTNAYGLKSGDHVQAIRAVKEDRLAAIDARERALVASSAIEGERADQGSKVAAERPFEITTEEAAAYAKELKAAYDQNSGYVDIGKVIPAVGLVIANRNMATGSQEYRTYQAAMNYLNSLAENYRQGLIGIYLRSGLIYGNDQKKEQYIQEIKDILSSNSVSMHERLAAQFLLIAIGDVNDSNVSEINGVAAKYSLSTNEGMLARIGLAMSSKDLSGYVTMLKDTMSGMVSADSRRMEVLVGLTAIANRDSLAASSAVVDNSKKGGIDFRPAAMPISYQTMGNFASLNLDLPKLSQEELVSFDVDKELAGLETMVEREILPSGERIKEVLAASSQKGEMEANRDRMMALLVKVGMLEETQCCLQEASTGYKEALVLADSLS